MNSPKLNTTILCIGKTYALFCLKCLTFSSLYDIIVLRYYDIKNGGGIVNKSDTPTKQKVSIPLRLPPELYEQMMELIHERKKEERGYSVNQYLTEILAKDLKEKAK